MNNKRSVELLSVVGLLVVMNVLSIYILFVKIYGGNIHSSGNKGTIANNFIYKKIDYNYESNKEYIDYTPIRINKYNENIVKDDNGVVLVSVDNNYVYDIKNISYYGLLLFGKYIETGNKEYYDLSKIQADYVLSKFDNMTGCFYNDYDISLYTNANNKEYEINTPWFSGSSQGLAISLLSRIYSVEKDDVYKDASILALEPINKEMSEGGLKTDLFGFTFYDDYSFEKPIYSLDSMMYITIALYDLNNIFELEDAEEMFYDCIKTIEFSLAFYDNQGISLKNLSFIKNDNLNMEYNNDNHTDHLYQLETLNQINKSEIFEYYLSIWSKNK